MKVVVLQWQRVWSHLLADFYEIGIYGKLGTKPIRIFLIVGHNIITWLFFNKYPFQILKTSIFNP